jgi:hypothetical protein
MFRRTMIALFAVASIGMLVPDIARRAVAEEVAVATAAAMVVVSEAASAVVGAAASAAAASRARLRLVPQELAPSELVPQDFKAAGLQATVSSMAVSTMAFMGEGSLPADSMGPATTTITMIIRITRPTIPTTTMVVVTSCSGACIPGTAGASGRSRSAGDSADFGLQNASAPGQLKLGDRARCG